MKQFLILLICGLFVCCSSTSGTANLQEQDIGIQTKTENNPEETFVLDDLIQLHSYSKLCAHYPFDSQKETKIYLGEGTYETGTIILFGTNNAVSILWNNDTQDKEIENIIHEAMSTTSDWKTKEGIKIGTSLAELEKLRGETFEFYGFGWDYAGTVIWERPKGEACLHLNLAPKNPDSPYINQLLGDGTYRSSADVAQKADLRVVRIQLSTPSE